MDNTINLIDETIGHFEEGALSVRAHTDDKTYIITKGQNPSEFVITVEEPGFPKSRTTSLDELYKDVFGIEAKY